MFKENILIPYSRLTSFYKKTSIYQDYTSSFELTQNFFEYDYSSLNVISEVMQSITISRQDRTKLYQAIHPYNKEKNNSSQVMQNLERLLDDDCYVIFTGQQCGLLTGPLYTIYKIITAILLAEALNKKKIGTFIPIFWSASEDHDLDEINHITFPNGQGGIESLSLDVENHGYSVQDIELTTQIDTMIQQLKENWSTTEFSNSLFSLLEHEKLSYNNSLTHLLSSLFKHFGLIIVEPYLLRKLAVPINQMALKKGTEINQVLHSEGEKLLQNGYNPSFGLSNTSHLFFYYNKKRCKLQWNETQNHFAILDGEVTFSFNEIEKLIETKPQLFSHNVILRPIVQDILFPTVAYVAGPGEINYYAQLKEVYKLFGKKMPVIYPRVSVTLFEKKFQKIQKQFNLTFEEILNHQYEEKTELFYRQFEKEQSVSQFVKNINQEIAKLVNEAEQTSQNVLESIKPSIRKIEFEVNKMKEKFLKKLEDNLGISKHQMERLKNGITPRLKPQERVYNMLYYQNLYGNDLISEIMEMVDITQFSHQVLIYE